MILHREQKSKDRIALLIRRIPVLSNEVYTMTNAVCPFKVVGEPTLCNNGMPISAGSIGTMDLSCRDNSSEEIKRLSAVFARPCMAWADNRCILLSDRRGRDVP